MTLTAVTHAAISYKPEWAMTCTEYLCRMLATASCKTATAKGAVPANCHQLPSAAPPPNNHCCYCRYHTKGTHVTTLLRVWLIVGPLGSELGLASDCSTSPSLKSELCSVWLGIRCDLM